MTKLDPRVRRTRRALQQSLLALVQETAYETITIQQITERGDLNRATFYLHYSSKEELLADALEGHFDAVVARIMVEVGERPYWEDATAARIVFDPEVGYKFLYQKQGEQPEQLLLSIRLIYWQR